MPQQTIDTTVSIHPERIRNLAELDEIAQKIRKYEEVTGSRAGIAVMQNRQLGASYFIVRENEAFDRLKDRSGVEWYVGFYSHEYLDDLRARLS